MTITELHKICGEPPNAADRARYEAWKRCIVTEQSKPAPYTGTALHNSWQFTAMLAGGSLLVSGIIYASLLQSHYLAKAVGFKPLTKEPPGLGAFAICLVIPPAVAFVAPLLIRAGWGPDGKW
jgi:hypothetical protein